MKGMWIEDRKEEKKKRKKLEERVFFLNYYLICGGSQESEWRWYMFQKKKKEKKKKRARKWNREINDSNARHRVRKRWRDCLVFKKPSFITHSIFIIHHSITNHLSLKKSQFSKVACWALVSNFDNSKNFTFCETYKLTWCSFYFLFLFFFSFFLQPPIPKLIELSEKELKRRRRRRPPRVKGKKKKKKKKKKKTNQIWLLTGLSNMCVFSKMPS